MAPRLIAWLTLVGAYIVLAYAGRAAGGDPPDDLLYRYSTAVFGVVQYAIVMLIILWIVRGPSRRDLLALRSPASWWRAGGLSLAVIVAIYVLTVSTEPFLRAGEEQGLTPSSWDPDRAGAYAVNFAVIALVAPVVEELMYRGAGYSLLVPFGQAVAIAVVGLTFGLVHGLVSALLVLTVFGAALAWLRARTGSVYPCIAVHSLFNSVALVVAVTT
jgi:membrane protease YdiL (CAAX protease family)